MLITANGVFFQPVLANECQLLATVGEKHPSLLSIVRLYVRQKIRLFVQTLVINSDKKRHVKHVQYIFVPFNRTIITFDVVITGTISKLRISSERASQLCNVKPMCYY